MEFIEQIESESVKKKFLTYYKQFIMDMGDCMVGEALQPLKQLQTRLCNSQVIDGRSGEKRLYLSKSYLSGLKTMLSRYFDFAYGKKYIATHPMYQLPEWRVYRKKENPYIEPLFAYLGNKHRILPNLIGLLPNNIEVFIDAFAGSAAVGVNINADKVIINEPNLFLLNIFKALHEIPPEKAWKMVLSIVEKYGLSGESEVAYYKCRDEYNLIPYEERVEKYWYWGLCLVYHSFNRSTVQFNLSGEYNAPYGFKKANLPLAERKFLKFAERVYNGNFTFSGVDYRELELNEHTFLYLDPPYLITTATYNKNWSEQQETEMYRFLEECNARGVKWGMSNVLKNNGVNNTMLRAWIKKMQATNEDMKLYYIENDYNHANFRRKNRGTTVEIFLTNF